MMAMKGGGGGVKAAPCTWDIEVLVVLHSYYYDQYCLLLQYVVLVRLGFVCLIEKGKEAK